ncbi:MAG: hypothetical protein JXB23_01295 [Candidatus Aminicenantes bacterium]|nr:hypothetical protein [Candidatus Aminicenantes bacterium]
MLTIFTIPKAFHSKTAIIQNNAISSWKRLIPDCQIILVGSETGVSEAARRFQICHEKNVIKNEYGTPMLDSAFDIAYRVSKSPFVCYVNADIIFLSGVRESLIKACQLKKFIITGRRTDLNVESDVDFANEASLNEFINRVRTEGRLHSPDGLDYFIFPNKMISLPAFPVGRVLWDNWVISNARAVKTPVIDATDCITAVHQNHDYTHLRGGSKDVMEGDEVLRNWKMIGRNFYPLDLRDANYMISAERFLKRRSGWRYYARRIVTIPIYVQRLSPIIGFSRQLYRLMNRISPVKVLNGRKSGQH